MFAFNALNALTRIYPGLMLARRQSGDAQLLAGLEPGQRLRATVQNSLANGEFMVALDARNARKEESRQTLHMKLPAGVSSGDVLNLIFVSREPQPTFTLTTETPPAGVFSRLSETGRLIDSLLRHPIFPNGSATISSATSLYFPLLAMPPADGADLARSLESVLGRSGLFYESHLAQWVAGTRSLAELMLEPQARLTGQPIRFFADAESNAALTVQNNVADTTLASDVPDAVHPSAMTLVRQQLDALEMHHFAWQGVAWPGQNIAWEVLEEAPQEREKEGGSDQSSAKVWQTCLRLTLPNLGLVTASLRLNARGAGEMSDMDVRLTAAEPMTAAALRGGTAPLANGLEAVGIKLLNMGVDLDKEADPREAAIALAYRAGQSAPQGVAKGRGLVAESIIRKARDHGIYVHESAELVSLLMQVDLDQHIPPQLYQAVAELLAWLYKLEAGAAFPLSYKALPNLPESTGRTEAMLLDQLSIMPDKLTNQ